MTQQHVVVVGAGIGGLACAVELARANFQVTVLDRAKTSGGKMREVAVGPAKIDAGPTVLTMRWVFDELFDAAGANLDHYVTLRPSDVLARHAWSADERLDLYSDINRSAAAIGEFAGLEAAAGYRAFCAEAQGIFETLRRPFLTDQQTNPLGLSRRVGLHRASAVMGLRPFDTLWRALGDHFRDPRLRQLFGRYATYCGSSPFAAPATLMLVAHVEREGVWLVQGGMQRLAEAMERLALAQGVKLRLGAHVDRILVQADRAAGVTLAGGEDIRADYVVVNAGAASVSAGAFGQGPAEAAPAAAGSSRSLSAICLAMHAHTQGFPLERHNVFFSSDYLREFDDIFKRGRTPDAPTIYVCAQDRGDPAADITDGERLLVLINAPATGDQAAFDEREVQSCQIRAFSHLERCGLRVNQDPAKTQVTTPKDFHALFPWTGGALYGAATHGWSAAFQRPGAGTRMAGLYLAGGGAHPGAGVPMAALSGRLAAKKLMRDHASTSLFRKGATVGGTSTR